MKVVVNEEKRKYGNLYSGDLIKDKIYEVAGEPVRKKNGDPWWLPIIDETGEEFLYPFALFDIIEE